MLEKLRKEHEFILKTLVDAETEVNFIRETGEIRRDALEDYLNFFKNYVGDFHQAREEKFLFKKLKGRTEEEYDPAVVMLAEHDLCNKMVKVMDDYFSAAKGAEGASEISRRHDDSEFCCSVTPELAADMLQDNLSTYLKLLKKHIARENDVVFPMAEKLFTPEELLEIENLFDESSFNPKKPDR